MLHWSFSCSGPLFSSFVCLFSIYSTLLHISLIPSLLHTTSRACSSTDRPWLAPSFELLELAAVVCVKLKLKTFETAHVPGFFLRVLFFFSAAFQPSKFCFILSQLLFQAPWEQNKPRVNLSVNCSLRNTFKPLHFTVNLPARVRAYGNNRVFNQTAGLGSICGVTFSRHNKDNSFSLASFLRMTEGWQKKKEKQQQFFKSH